MDSLKYFSQDQLKMVQLASEMRYYAERCYNPIPDFLALCRQWYLKVSPGAAFVLCNYGLRMAERKRIL